MLSERRSHTTLPAADLDRARAFWEGLGFMVRSVQPNAVLFETGAGSVFAVSRGSALSTGAHTQMSFTSPDLEADVAELEAKGVAFEAYDLPGFRTVGGIAAVGPNRAAWFKDTEGNLIGLIQFADPTV